MGAARANPFCKTENLTKHPIVPWCISSDIVQEDGCCVVHGTVGLLRGSEYCWVPHIGATSILLRRRHRGCKLSRRLPLCHQALGQASHCMPYLNAVPDPSEMTGQQQSHAARLCWTANPFYQTEGEPSGHRAWTNAKVCRWVCRCNVIHFHY